MNDKNLIKDLKNKKRSALEKIIESYSAYVSVIVYNTIGMIASKEQAEIIAEYLEDIEEVVSDVFISLWNNGIYIKDDCELRPYIGAIARNKAKNKLREMKNTIELNEKIVSDKGNPETEAVKADESRRLYDAVMSLGEPDSEIMIRFYYNGEKIREISKALSLNASTIKTKLKRGREKLKNYLEERKEQI